MTSSQWELVDVRVVAKSGALDHTLAYGLKVIRAGIARLVALLTWFVVPSVWSAWNQLANSGPRNRQTYLLQHHVPALIGMQID